MLNQEDKGETEYQLVKSTGRSVKCKKCGSRFRVIFGLSPDAVSRILERDCGYKFKHGGTPLSDLSNVCCAKCGNSRFVDLPLNEKLKLQKDWLKKFSSSERLEEAACFPLYLPTDLIRRAAQAPSVYNFHVPRISMRSNCPICDKEVDKSKTTHFIPICNEHYVTNIRKFLIQKHYLNLKKKNNEIIKKNPRVAAQLIIDLHWKIFFTLTWEPETISELQFLRFNEYSFFAGYLILRMSEVLPDLGKRLRQGLSGRKLMAKPMSQEFKSAFENLLLRMSAEFELFISAKLAVSGYFYIAVDNEENPRKILIVPRSDEDNINRNFSLILNFANSQWYGTFRRVLNLYGTIPVADPLGGAFFKLDLKFIEENFELFKTTWNQTFQCNTTMTFEDFKNLKDWLKWVVAPSGFTETDQSGSLHFDSYIGFGLRKELVFETLNQVLPDVRTKHHLISTKNLSKKDPFLFVFAHLAQIAHGFKISGPERWSYFVPCREWFYNAIMPVFVRLVSKTKMRGRLFEENMARVLSFYSKTGVREGSQAPLGLIVEPEPPGLLIEPEEGTSKLNWKILEKNLSIYIPNHVIPKKIRRHGEVDVMVLVEHDLYLIELKSINLRDKEATEYLKKKTPVQCAKYAHWVRNCKQFEEILHKHGLKNRDIRSVKILACCSGVFENLTATFHETGECFAVVPEFVLFSIMAGFFKPINAASLTRIEGMALGLKIAYERNPPVVCMFNLQEEIEKKLSSRCLEWIRLAKVDRKSH